MPFSMIIGYEAKIASMMIDTVRFLVEQEQSFDFVLMLFWIFICFLSSLSSVVAVSFGILKREVCQVFFGRSGIFCHLEKRRNSSNFDTYFYVSIAD